jgi:hypothetical protein
VLILTNFFQSYVKKYLNNLEVDHPLSITFRLNSDYLEYFNDLLRDLDNVPNLLEKIKEMNSNKIGWRGIRSELEFAKEIKKLHPEFIKPPNSSISTVDLKSSVVGTDVFFEVKLLDDDSYKDNKVVVEVSETNLTTKITYSKLTEEEINKILERRNKAITTNKEDSFSIGNADIKIQRNPPFPPKEINFHIKDLDGMREKILKEFKAKEKQLKKYSPIFLVIDCLRPDYNKINFTNFVYGKNGLFTYPETNCLNGLVARLHGKSYFFLNPNSKTEISNYVKKEMKKWFEYNSFFQV